ncbi:MAG: hypothetical protein ABGZ17_16035 [Planctomycetaceae bacterium]
MLRSHIAVALTFACGLAAGVVSLTGCSSGDAPSEFQSFDSLVSKAPSNSDPATAAAAANTTGGGSQSASKTETDGDQPSPVTPAVDSSGQPGSDNPDNATTRRNSTEPTAAAITPQTRSSQTESDQTGLEQTATTDSDATTPASDPEQPAKPRPVKILIAERVFQTEGPQKSLRVTYDDIDLLKVLNMEPVTPNAAELMPDWLRNLNNRRILIRGFMYPTFKETGLQAFILARDNQICCFGRDPKIYDLVRIALRKGVTSDYIQGRPFDVEGTFRIQPESDDGELYRLYTIDDAVVIDR